MSIVYTMIRAYAMTRANKTTPDSHEEYVGRVIKMRSYTADRNMSDTLDYSDYQRVTVHEALVWLGESYTDKWTGAEVRPTIANQFKWIDVSNHFTWRGDALATATVDAITPRDETWGVMWKNYYEWETLQRALEEKATADAARAADERKRREAAIAKKLADVEAKNREAQAACEALLTNKKFARGATVTLKSGVSGKIVWTGAKKFRNKWNARVGVKDSRGEVHWVNASDVK